MKIGILSDTHGWLDPQLFEYFKDCDELWHAGDIGDISIIDTLNEFKPTLSVFGNIDPPDVSSKLEEDLWIKRQNQSILITHIAGRPGRYHKRLTDVLQNQNPDILVCGHSHILKIEYDRSKSWLYINPGACGNQGLHKVRTALRFELNSGKPTNMEVIELGMRGK